MLAKGAAHKVQGHGIGAAIGEGHAVGDDAQDMPERIVIVLGGGPVTRAQKNIYGIQDTNRNIKWGGIRSYVGASSKHP